MTISTRDHLINAMINNSSRILIDKTSIANATAGGFHSLWRSTGQPGQGAVPTSAAVCDNNLVGCLQFTQQTAPNQSVLGILEAYSSNAGTVFELHDRLMHMGGLNGTITTAQNVNLDIAANLATSNLDSRKGDSNYSDVQWWMEWYTDTGATAVTATINVTFNDGSSNNLSVLALSATRRASGIIPLNGLISAADSGKYIRDINSCTLSASTGAAGNFGFTATRYRAGIYIPVAPAKYVSDYANLGLPEIPNGSCLFPIVIPNTTNTGVLRATGKIAHG